MLATYQLPVEEFGFVTEGLLYADEVPDNTLANLYCVPSSATNAIVGLQNSSLYRQVSNKPLAGDSYGDWRKVAVELGKMMNTQLPLGTLYNSEAEGLRTYIQSHQLQDVLEVVGMYPTFPVNEIGNKLGGVPVEGFVDKLPTWDFFAENLARGYAVVTDVAWLNDTLDGPDLPVEGHSVLVVGMTGDPARGDAQLTLIDPERAFQDHAFEAASNAGTKVPLFARPEPTPNTVALKTSGSVSLGKHIITVPGQGGLQQSSIPAGGLILQYHLVKYTYNEGGAGAWIVEDVGFVNGVVLNATVVRLKAVQRPPIRPAATFFLSSGEWGPAPYVLDHAALASAVSGQPHALPYVVKNVVSGRLFSEEDGIVREVAEVPESVAPAALLRFLADRTVTPNKRLQWEPPAEAPAKGIAFHLLGSGQVFGAEPILGYWPVQMSWA